MQKPRSARPFLAAVSLIAAGVTLAGAVEPSDSLAPGPLAGVAPRDFATGVMTTIAANPDASETVSLHDVVELTENAQIAWEPKLLPASQTLASTAERSRFTRDTWTLEFGFKPLRMIRVADPSAESGQRLVWYLVYRVKNTGEALRPTADDQNGAFEAETVASGAVRFSPHFVLEGHDVAPSGGKIYRAYLDRVMPEAVAAIRQRELPGRRLWSNIAMPLEPIAEGEERWGVAMWTDIDPEMDFFSVYAGGLSNAYDWTDPPGAYTAGDPPGRGREFVRKTLQLNFWRPGDRFLQHESEVRYGVAPGKAALYGVDEGVDHRWVYR
ncbi:MAG: hypothetical protein AAF805_09330 [Planctomycetota bacterium]